MTNPFQFRGLIDPTQKFIYLSISKNASMKISSTLRKEGWTKPPVIPHTEINNFINDKRIFCVLRDPYQRYLTGFVDYISGLDSIDYNEVIKYSLRKLIRYKDPLNDDILRLLFYFNKFNYDSHTELQSTALVELDTAKIDFFYLNDKLGYQLNKYFKNYNVIVPFNNSKVNARFDEHYFKSLLTEFFEKEEHIKFKENLLNYLKPDYELLKSIEWYNV